MTSKRMNVECKVCGGYGHDARMNPCKACKGKTRVLLINLNK